MTLPPNSAADFWNGILREHAEAPVIAERVTGEVSDIKLTPKAAVALKTIGKWGLPFRALHSTHRRLFLRHQLIDVSPLTDRCFTTRKGDAVLAGQSQS